jgi:hypothetical protein
LISCASLCLTASALEGLIGGNFNSDSLPLA